MGQTTTPAWPVAFTRLNVDAEEFLTRFPCNHIHGVYGDHVKEWETFAALTGMEFTLLG